MKLLPAIFSIGAFLSFGTLARSELAIQVGDINTEGGQSSYVYQLTAKDMVNSDVFVRDSKQRENVTLKDQGGTRFVAADAGKAEATILYLFDFTGVPYTPQKVTWRDRLTLFPAAGKDGLRVDIVSEWSTDDITYHTICEAASKSGTVVNVGKLGDDVEVQLPPGTQKVYYRVWFKAMGGGGVFKGDSAQWNRTGANAALFRANFVLQPES